MNPRKIIFAALLTVATPLPAFAEIFLCIPSIPGAVTGQYDECIEILSMQQGAANVNGTPVFFPVSLLKEVDKTSPLLVQATMLGTNLGTVNVEVASAPLPARMLATFYKLELHDAKVVAVSSSSAGVLIDESITLTCSSFTLTYTSMSTSPAGVTTSGSCGN